MSLSDRRAQMRAKGLCKSFTMLSFVLSKEALNLTKRDMQEHDQSSWPLRSGLWPMTGMRCQKISNN